MVGMTMILPNASQRAVDQYQGQLESVGEERVLRIGYGGYAKTAKLAERFGEVHCVDFSSTETAASTRTAELHPNVFTYLVRRPDLEQFPNAHFIIVDVAAMPWHADREWVSECFRSAARVLKPGGLLQMRLPANHMAEAELVDFTKRHILQTLILEAADTSGATLGVWRRREMNWREELPTLAAITAVRIVKITNSQKSIPVAPQRGIYASVNITVEGLPAEADLFDLEIRVAGARARILSIGPADSKDQRHLLVNLPELEDTGLLPVDLYWMEERMGKPGILRVVPAPPSVPRVISVIPQVGRMVAVVIDELTDPEDFAATIDGRPAWGYENRCLNGQIPRYEIKFQLPDAVEAGERDLTLRIGKRELPPTSILVPEPDPILSF